MIRPPTTIPHGWRIIEASAPDISDFTPVGTPVRSMCPLVTNAMYEDQRGRPRFVVSPLRWPLVIEVIEGTAEAAG
jgi:hypothetical protein